MLQKDALNHLVAPEVSGEVDIGRYRAIKDKNATRT
jgi:hypothetical protein